MRLNVVIQNNSVCHHSSDFIVSSRVQLLFKQSTIPCTIDHLSMILVVLKDIPVKVPKQHPHHFASRRYTSEFLGPWVMISVSTPCFDICLQVHSGVPMFHCMCISMCAHFCSSVSCFGTHLAQFLRNLRFLWMMEYANPHLMSNLLAVSVTAICLSS